MARSRLKQPRAAVPVPRRVWKLEDAKARFSEVVQLALSEGPQRVTRRGRPAVLIVADSGDDGRDAANTEPGAWVRKLRGSISSDIDLMALIGPRERHDPRDRRNPLAKLLRERRR